MVFPPVGPIAKIYTDAIHKVGFTSSLGLGGALSLMEIRLSFPWMEDDEIALLQSMSRKYLSEREIGKNPFGIPPIERQE